MEKLLSTKEIAEFLGVNEKMVYTLINEKGLPATKITGKWLFPKNLVDQWIASRTINYPQQPLAAVEIPNLLLLAGSNDVLLEQTLSLFRRRNPEQVACFGNLGSLGGLKALRQGLCHIATSHLVQEDAGEYRLPFAATPREGFPAVINFCRREQGLLVAKGNPLNIQSSKDMGNSEVRIANRPLAASTRLLLDQELQNAGLDCCNVKGYEREFQTHLEVGLEILAGRADTGLAIRAVATLLDLDFIPLCWERFDLLIPKSHFFLKSIQLFLELLHDSAFQEFGVIYSGYDLSLSGKMICPPTS